MSKKGETPIMHFGNDDWPLCNQKDFVNVTDSVKKTTCIKCLIILKRIIRGRE